MSVEFKDNSDAWAKAIVESCNEGLTAAAAYTADAFRVNIGSEGGRAIALSRKIGRRRSYWSLAEGESIGRREGRRHWLAAPPGKFPGTRTGALRRSMTSTKADGLVAYAGSNLKYALYLETGWERRKPLTDKQLRMIHAMMRDLEDSGLPADYLFSKTPGGGGQVHARPWLRRTVREHGGRIAKVFSGVASSALAARVAQ